MVESQESSFAQTATAAGSSAADIDTPLSIYTAMRSASVSQGPASSLALTAATAGSSVEGGASQAAESPARAVEAHVRRDRSVGERPSLLCKPDVSANSSSWRFLAARLRATLDRQRQAHRQRPARRSLLRSYCQRRKSTPSWLCSTPARLCRHHHLHHPCSVSEASAASLASATLRVRIRLLRHLLRPQTQPTLARARLLRHCLGPVRSQTLSSSPGICF